MSQRIDIIKQPRLKTLEAIEALSLDQLNTMLPGFNNNLIWNLGHMVATQHGVIYKRAGLDLPIDETFFDTYKPGTRPERLYTAADLEQIKSLFISTLDNMETDLQTNRFGNYPQWTTRYGAEIHNIDEAVAFLPFHDGLHIGVITAMMKMV
jgi:uncharacterized damage-inducible protein DinB